MQRLVLLALVVIGVMVLLPLQAAAATFTVSNLNNSGAASLRQAIQDANAASGPDTITFAAGVMGTIELTSPLPFITGTVTITGPGAGVLTVDVNGTGTGFGSAAGTTVTISGFTVTGALEAVFGQVAR